MKESHMSYARSVFRVGIWGVGLILGLQGCSGNQSSALPPDVQGIIFLQRPLRNSGGNVFDYQDAVPGARLVKLEPPAADGTLTVLTADPMFANADIMAWDLSFDAKSIVFSANLGDSSPARYHLFRMNIDGSNIAQITEGDRDFVYPIFLPGQKVLFTTNENVEEGTPQFQDEYERAVTAQVGIIGLDGKNMELGPRNVSHRVAPALLPDGHVLYTEWRHLGMINDGHLRLMNADMTGVREAFGGELSAPPPGKMDPATNSYLRARYVGKSPSGSTQVVAVGTSRDRTLQAGRLLLVDLGKSEATSSVINMTPKIPGDQAASNLGVGRYYDAEPVGAEGSRKFLASWADREVQSEVLATGKTNANFGLYVYDGFRDTRYPVYDDPNYWDVQARPIKARPEPSVTASPIKGEGFVLSAINVYNSMSSGVSIPAGTAVKVRLIEGFSGEEGFSMFGTTEFDGQSLYGEVPVQPDGSFAARVPANVPVHMQVIDKFALAIADEPIWISGRAGEQRTCGGCHENRATPIDVLPGQIQAILNGAQNLDVPRATRISTNYTYGNVRGVPWDKALQPIFDAKCISCHDGVVKPGNPSFTVTDMTSGTSQTFVFDLRGQKINVMVGEMMTGDFTASYLSLMGLGEILGDAVVSITGGTPFNFAVASNAAGSKVIQKLNPPQRFPVVDETVRRFPGAIHPVDVGGTALTPDEYYLLSLSIDMGGQFFSRENKAP
ncbi:MAG: hypothetical protein H7X95_01250 [Deltaproteobacteria bacterium]|nr:hypothetical protein [Deltaproteobacteria bacterium]